MKMFNKIWIATFLLLTVYENVNGAMKKSWKSAANFDADIPKFTPFESEESLPVKDASLNEVVIQTTETSTNPSPSAETLISKISSKIKAPSNKIADIYNKFYQDMHKKPNNDFGVFEGNKEDSEASSEAFEDFTEQAQPGPEHEQINIQQILNELSEEADKESASNDSTADEENDIEISSIENGEKNTTQFKVGPLMNVTINPEDSLVNVNLDKNTLKEIFTGSSSS